MFDHCNSDTLQDRKAERKKTDYRTYYGAAKVYTEWSTFDRFSVFDCSEKMEKWRFFTGQECDEVWCEMKNSCEGISCNCCEELRYETFALF
jgi:hypothetical protein